MGLLDHKMQPGEPRWGTTRYNLALEEIVSLLAGKAPAVHSHGAGGEVVGIGTSTDRPKVTDGFLFYETDTGLLQILNADGSVKFTVARLVDVAARAGRMTGQVDWESVSSLIIRAGLYEANGVLYELPSDLTGWSPGTLGASDDYYIILDPPDSGTTLGSTNFFATTTEPTEDWAKGGWYDNAGNRCVGLFKTNSASEIVHYAISQDGGFYSYNRGLPIIDSSSPPSTLTTFSAGVPALGRLSVDLIGQVQRTGTNADLHIANGHVDGGVGADTRFAEVYSSTESGIITTVSRGRAVTAPDGHLYYAATADVAKIYLLGFELPLGLRRTT